MQQVILIIYTFFSLLIPAAVNAQVPFPDIFKTEVAFDAFFQQMQSHEEIGNKRLIDEVETRDIHYDSFIPAFDESGQFNSIKLEYSDGKQCVIQRTSENTFILQKGRKKLRKRCYTISLQAGATNKSRSIMLWDQTWLYIQQMAGLPTPSSSQL
ncbi:MAG: hypothetical protein QE487_07330 [Fluviicola sp.]|nr:hypothetical protein [Fluviicola sp.]